MSDDNRNTVNIKGKLCKEVVIRLGAFSAIYFLIIYGAKGYFQRPISALIFLIFPDYAYEPIVSFLYVMVPVAYVVCCALIIYKAIAAASDYLDILAKSVYTVLSQEEEYVVLPPDLKVLETGLNQVKHDSIKNRQIAMDAERRKNELVVYLAHDIRTPLTSVIGYLSLLNEARDMPEMQRVKYTSVALEKAYSLERLVNEFFEITRYNFQTIILEKEYIRLGRMLEQMADEFYPSLQSENKSIEVQAEAGMTLYADPGKMARVFNNILKNAISYSHAGSTINVGAKTEGTNIVIRFRNKGRQIPKEKLDSIFQKFYRGDDARASSKGGAGLGLAIAKEIVERHGGTIQAESTVDFTEFTVSLPLGSS